MTADATSELRLRLQAALSLSEMRRLLTSWGADPAEVEGDAATLAHRVVRLGDKSFGRAELVRRLRAEKPLVEWPDVAEDDAAKWAGEPTLLELDVPPRPEEAKP